MVRNRKSNVVVLAVLVALILSGCFRNEPVENYQMGLVMEDGVSISEVVGPGLHTNNAWRSELYTVNVSNITTTWNDPELVTEDKQPIGLTLSITFARKRIPESIAEMWKMYNAEAKDDAILTNLVLAKVPGVAKSVTAQNTLDEMLGISSSKIVSSTLDGSAEQGREVTAQRIEALLRVELDRIFVDLVAVELSNIAPSASFMQALEAKAQAQIDIEVSSARTRLITEQLAQEKATTDIELEKARRDNLVNQEKAKTFEQSPQLLQLELMKLTAQMLDAGDVIIYVPENSNITSVLTQSGSNVVPTE